MIGIAQEKAPAFKGSKRTQGQKVGFDDSRQSVLVNHYYVYLHAAEFGPAFITVCTHAPYAVQIYLNGPAWVKQQLRQEGLAFEALDNGFWWCEDPARLQALCDELGPEPIQAFFDKWQHRLPWRLTAADQAAGYRYRLSIWQAEFSRTQVFDAPVPGRQWFEAVIGNTLDVGRPDRIQLLLERRVTKAPPGYFRTQVLQQGVSPSWHADYKKTPLKQYFKDPRALGTETTINHTKDFGIGQDIANLPFLQPLGCQIHRRLLDAQHLSADATLSPQSLQPLVLPTVPDDGQRAPALPLGQPRVLALSTALTSFGHIPNGFTNQSLRQLVADLLRLAPEAYQAAQRSYDLRRLRLKGIIWRIPNSYRYQLTSDGRNVAWLLAKLDARVFRRLFAALDPLQPVPSALTEALDPLDQALAELLHHAQIRTASA